MEDYNYNDPTKDKKHVVGTMNIDEQEKTYQGFIKWSIRTTCFIIAILIFLALYAS